MSPRRRLITTRGFRRSRRESFWFAISANQSTMAAASTAVLASSLNAAALSLRPFTVIRTRLVFYARSDQQAASEQYSVALGFAVVSDQAIAIGVTAVPTPDTDRDSDLFFVYEDLVGRFTFSDATGFIEQGVTKYIDSKAMRKVEGGQDVAIVLESTTLSAGVIGHIAGRMLIKLH